LEDLNLAINYLKKGKKELHSVSLASLIESERTRKELDSAAGDLIQALCIRSEFMKLLGATFPSTTLKFLEGKFPGDSARSRRKENVELCEWKDSAIIPYIEHNQIRF
jgi:hypothetical protein